jgi:hypothetical protein
MLERKVILVSREHPPFEQAVQDDDGIYQVQVSEPVAAAWLEQGHHGAIIVPMEEAK